MRSARITKALRFRSVPTVKAGKEGRKFRVIAIIPAIPGFAGDLRDDAAMGTRAIMDYQYKSICRGEHSIFEQIRAQGVNPEDHIFLVAGLWAALWRMKWRSN